MVKLANEATYIYSSQSIPTHHLYMVPTVGLLDSIGKFTTFFTALEWLIKPGKPIKFSLSQFFRKVWLEKVDNWMTSNFENLDFIQNITCCYCSDV